MNSIREKKSGVLGVRMTIVGIGWITGMEAQANGEAFSDGIAANYNTLRLEFKRGKWIVTNDKPDGVS